jgi:hypothetical protein
MSGQSQQSPIEMLKTSLQKENDKIKKINEIIKNLEQQQNKVNKKDSSFFKILGKYITFLKYIKSIIEVKIGKDNKIIELQENVFYSINVITNRIQNINLSLPQEEANISKTPETQQQNNDNKETTIEQLDKRIEELNIQLNDLKTKQSKEKVYLLDFNTSLTGLNLDNKDIIEEKKKEINIIQNECTKNIKNNVKTFITTLNIAQSGGTNAILNSPSFKDSTEGYYDIINNNIFKTPNSNYGLKNNITSNQKIHTDKLKEIKEAYEKELGINVENYKKICDALITLLTNINETNDKLKNFNKSKEAINKKNKSIETIKIANRDINTKNKIIENVNKKINDKRDKKAKIEQLSSEISILQDLIAKGEIIYKILDLQDIKNDKIFKANHDALVGEHGTGGLLGEITNAQKKLTNIIIPQNPTQGQATGQQVQGKGNTEKRQNTGLTQGQVNTGQQLSAPASTFFKEATNQKIIQIQEIDARTQIDSKLNELELLKNNNPSNQERIKEIEEEIKQLFQDSDYTLNTDLTSKFAEIKVPNNVDFTELQKYFLLRYITLLSNEGKFEEGLNELNNYEKSKEIINSIFKSDDREKRQKLLIKLYEQRPNRRKEGGKYKMKKTKKSKSKTSKATSKKAKSTKTEKQKAPRTQTKSYNNPKYKKKVGGFVRGGVLFPESFYRSDIVM